MKIAIVTNCTSSASLPVIPYLDGLTMPKGITHIDAAKEWASRATKAMKDPKHKGSTSAVRAMYTGISFRTVLRALDALHESKAEAQLFIVSLGFGLVKAEDEIASYNINIQPADESPSSLLGFVTGEPFEPIRWWEAVNKSLYGVENPIAQVVMSGEYDLVIVAVTNSFLSLISADLASISGLKEFEKVRIVGPKGTTWLSKYMRHIAKRGVILPYNSGLNDLMPGNRNDFAQRAAVHFIRTVLIPGGFKVDLASDRGAVTETFSKAVEEKTLGPNIDSVVKSLREEHPEFTVTQAFKKASEVNNGITFDKFQRHWSIQDKSEPGGDDMDLALAALDAVNVTLGSDSQGEVVDALKLFVNALKVRGGGRFTVRDVNSWAKLYFDKKGQSIPISLASPNKLGRMLSSIHAGLGLTQHTNVIGGKSYEVRDE